MSVVADKIPLSAELFFVLVFSTILLIRLFVNLSDVVFDFNGRCQGQQRRRQYRPACCPRSRCTG